MQSYYIFGQRGKMREILQALAQEMVMELYFGRLVKPLEENDFSLN